VANKSLGGEGGPKQALKGSIKFWTDVGHKTIGPAGSSDRKKIKSDK